MTRVSNPGASMMCGAAKLMSRMALGPDPVKAGNEPFCRQRSDAHEDNDATAADHFPLMSVPEDVFYRIMDFLGHHELKVLRITCRRARLLLLAYRSPEPLMFVPSQDTLDRVREWMPLGALVLLIDPSLDFGHPEVLKALAHPEAIYSLLLYRHRLTAVPEPMMRCRFLRALDISYNHVSDLSQLTALKHLSELDIGGNPIESLAPLGSLTSLRVLHMSTLLTVPHVFDSFDEAAAGLSRLATLDMSNNLLDNLPLGLSRLTGLRVLILHRNRLKDSCLGVIGTLGDSLEALEMPENHVQNFGEDIGKRLLKLRLLVLRDNWLTSADGVAMLPELRELDISENWLTSLPDLTHLVKLKTLVKSNNPGLSPGNFRRMTLTPRPSLIRWR